MSRGKTSVGIDVRAKSVVLATLTREGRKTTLADIQTINTPQLLERGGYRDTHHIIEAINQALESHITTNPLISLSAARSRTLMTTVPLKGLTRQKATQVITAQANRHFPNPNELTLAVDTAHLTIKGRKVKATNWLAAAVPNEHLKAIAEIQEHTGRAFTRLTPKAIAALHAAYPNITTPGDHLILSGADDGADLTLILGGVIEVIRLLGPNLERDIKPELARTLDYLRSEKRDPPTLHLAAYQEHGQHLAETLEVDVMNVAPWDALTLDEELDTTPETLDGAITAIGLALGALDAAAPDINLRLPQRRSRTSKPATSAPRANMLQVASFALVLAGGGYHLMTTLQVNDLRANVNTLNSQLMTNTSPERMTVDELQTSIDELLRHEALAQQLTTKRLRPTRHIARVVNGLPSTSRSSQGDGLRFQTLALRAATEVPAAHQPLNDSDQPATIITITGLAPNNLTLEQDLRELEQDTSLRAHVRRANRTNPEDPTDTSISTQIEILTLHQPTAPAAPEAEEHATILPLEAQPSTTLP